MGSFSFKCSVSGEPVNSDSQSGEVVYIFLLREGKILEEMYGMYDSYGHAFTRSKYSCSNPWIMKSFEWKMPWSEVCDLMFDDNADSGLMMIKEKYYDGLHGLTLKQSQSDPNQGDGNYIRLPTKSKPYHVVHNK